MTLPWFSKVFCKPLVIPERDLQAINDSTWRRVFIPRILPRTGMLCKDCMAPNTGNCVQLMMLQIGGCSVNIPWFHTEEGAVCKYLLTLYVGGIQNTFQDFAQMKGVQQMLLDSEKTKNLYKYPLMLHTGGFGSSSLFNTQASAWWVSGDSAGCSGLGKSHLRKESWGMGSFTKEHQKSEQARAQSP